MRILFSIMATMTIRTTVAFDPATVARWERLSKRWGVSKSEALRRALEAAEEKDPARAMSSAEKPDFSKMSPIQIMDWLRDHPQVPPGWGNAFRAELKAARQRDAEIEEERESRHIMIPTPFSAPQP
jgi:hypothetical protein